MKEGPKNEVAGRQVALEAAARRYGTELLHANLIIPQTYGAIRTIGARSILTETMRGDDVSPSELYAALDAIENEITAEFYEQMLAAHKASVVEVEKFEGKTIEEVKQYAAAIFRYHERVAEDGAVKALKFAKKHLGAKTEEELLKSSVQLLDLMREALLDESLRKELRMYQLNVAMEKESKHAFAEVLSLEWGKLFMRKLQDSSFAPRTREELRPFAEFFQDMAMSDSGIPDKVDNSSKDGSVVE